MAVMALDEGEGVPKAMIFPVPCCTGPWDSVGFPEQVLKGHELGGTWSRHHGDEWLLVSARHLLTAFHACPQTNSTLGFLSSQPACGWQGCLLTQRYALDEASWPTLSSGRG